MPDNEKEQERAELHRTKSNKLICPPAAEQGSEIVEEPFLFNGAVVREQMFLKLAQEEIVE